MSKFKKVIFVMRCIEALKDGKVTEEELLQIFELFEELKK